MVYNSPIKIVIWGMVDRIALLTLIGISSYIIKKTYTNGEKNIYNHVYIIIIHVTHIIKYYLYIIYILFIYYLYIIYILFIYYLNIIYILFVYYLYIIYILFIYYLYIIYILFIYYPYIIYILYIIYITPLLSPITPCHSIYGGLEIAALVAAPLHVACRLFGLQVTRCSTF